MPEISKPRELGTTGLRTLNNRIVDDELARGIRWPHSLKTFDKMQADPLIAGSLFMIQQYIRQVDWSVEPKGGVKATEGAIKKAEIISDALFKHLERSWDQTITDILSFLKYGFSFHEITYKMHEGNLIWKDFPIRSQKTISEWKLDSKGYLKSIGQVNVLSDNSNGIQFTSSNSITEISTKRLLHFRTSSEKNSPLGRSILKNAYEAWYFKTKLEEIEAIGLERDLAGLPKIGIPSEYFGADPVEDPERHQVFLDMVRMAENARNNEQACIALPTDVDEMGKPLFTFELISSSGKGSNSPSKVIERYDYRIAQSMLTDFILMGSSSTGSFALSDNKVGSFVQSLEAFLEVIAEQFNRKAIPDLFERNGWDMDEMPILSHKPIGQASLGELGSFLQNVAAFVTPDKTLENAVRRRADLPELDENNQYIDTPTATHQAHSQRIGMEASASRNSSSNDTETSEESSPEITEDDAESILKSLMKGESLSG